MTSADAAGVPTAKWNQLSTATLNNAGAVAFTATLEHDGVITTDNDTGVWLYEGTDWTLLAQTGAGSVPGIDSVDFATLGSAALSNSGAVVVSGSLVTGENGITSGNNQGIWRYDGIGSSLHARTGAGNVAGITNADFIGFPNPISSPQFAIAPDGQVAFFARLAVGNGGVLSNNNSGLWSYNSINGTLLARSGSFGAPGATGREFFNFYLPAINANNQVAALALLEKVGDEDVTRLGIWRYTGTNGELLARTGVGEVPGVIGVDFTDFDLPRINEAGQAAFSASMSNGTKGIWLFTDSTGELIISATSSVPSVPGGGFAELTLTELNNSGQILAAAVLEPGVGGVTANDNSGLWLFNGDDSLIARTGSGNVPGVPAANFASFGEQALNEKGQIAFAADLQIGTGGIDDTNDSGIWIVDPTGDSWLVAREGDQLAGRTIASLDFVGDGPNQSNGFNDIGELAFKATFTDDNDEEDDESGLFLFRPYAADFDRDGDVDDTDLTMWETAFDGISSADADGDTDTDGADFLIWQLEFGKGVSSPLVPSVVPEPANWLLLICGLLTAGRPSACRRK